MPVLLVAVAGLAGSFAESLVGAVAEPRGWMGGDLLNVLNTAVGAIVVVAMIKAWATL
jgi:uncharacterized membrane protein